ncbi:ribonuclease H-like domain-containing protein, partial [Tanacetum coccineum]
LQKLVSRLEILGVVTPPEDLNVKFLRSLPSEWDTHMVVWMNKPDFDTMGLDDLYNNFKIVKQNVKRSAGANNDDKNLALGASSTNNINTVNLKVSTGTTKVNTASTEISTASFSDATVYAFLSTQPQGSQLVHEDLEQLHDDDLEEMDLKWNMALLSMRARKFYQRTGRKIIIDGSSTAGYDKSKVECFNCHKMGHFARECRAPRSKDNRNWNQGSSSKAVRIEDASEKAMCAIDGAGFDWSDMAEEEIQANMALMAFSDSEVTNDKSCSKSCLKNYEALKKQYDDLLVKLDDTGFKASTYKRGSIRALALGVFTWDILLSVYSLEILSIYSYINHQYPFPVEDDSDIGSPGIDGPPIMPEDPYAYIMAVYEVPPSPDYIPGPEVPPSLTTYLALRTDYPADGDDDDDEDEDEDEDEEEEEHPAPADSVPPIHRMTARISNRDGIHITSTLGNEVERLLALTTTSITTYSTIISYYTYTITPPITYTITNTITLLLILRFRELFNLRKWVRFAFSTPSHEVRGGVQQRGLMSLPRCSTSRELDYDITDTWDDPETTSMYGIMEDAQDDRSQLRGRVNLLYRDRPVHRRLAVMIEREAKMAREAWGLSMDASDYAHHKRQRVILELLASDHKRQVQLTKTLRLLKGLQTQMVEFQRQHGPAKGPAQPDAPGEAGSSS